MTRHSSTSLQPREKTRLSGAGGLLPAAVVVAVVGFVVALLYGLTAEEGIRRFYFAYLVNFAFFVSLSLGALFFVLIQHTARAGWSVNIRRMAECQAATMAFLAIGSLPILVSVLTGGDLYSWAGSDAGHHAEEHGTAHEGAHAASAEGPVVRLAADDVHGTEDRMPASLMPSAGGDTFEPLPVGGLDPHTEAYYVAKKRAYLNVPFFVARCLLYFAVWAWLGVWFWRQSTRQDESGEAGITSRMQRLAPPMLVVFALTVTFAAFDLLMSLSPAWYSTIFGGYFFAGSFVGGCACLILVLMALQRSGFLLGSVTNEHYHDLGKFLFGFVFFWGYIAFSQYMLIWYASLPETVYWFSARGVTSVAEHVNPWTYVAVLLLLGHFIIPFVGLISRWVKRHPAGLAFWAVWLLVFHWIDLWWIAMPEMGPKLRLGIPELAAFLAVGGLFVAGLSWFASRHALVPLRDPRRVESLAFENY